MAPLSGLLVEVVVAAIQVATLEELVVLDLLEVDLLLAPVMDIIHQFQTL